MYRSGVCANMKATPELDSGKPGPDPNAALAFADALGAALASIDLYGIHHKLAIHSLETCFERLSAILSAGDRLDLARSDDGRLILNRTPITVSNSRLLAVARRLSTFRMSGFILKPGLDVDEFMKLIVFLSQPRQSVEGKEARPRSLDELGLTHVSSTRTVVTQVEDGAPEERNQDSVGKADVEQILAFLRGTVGSDDKAAAEEVLKAAANPESLADLIMQATAVRQVSSGVAGGESLGELVVGCLRRTFDTLISDPPAKTAKGKKEVKRTLAVLEEKVLARLRKFATEGFEDATAPVSEEFEGMREEIEIDDVVTQYVKSRNAGAEKEAKLLRYMRRKGRTGSVEEGLRERLEAEGLGVTEWQNLVVRSAATPLCANGDRVEAGASTALPVLLAELTRLLHEKPSGEEVEEVAKKVSRDVRCAIARMTDKVDELSASPRETPAQREVLRGRVLGVLRELLQELCQPLSVINGAVQMLAEGLMGNLSATQKQLLELAFESAERVRLLMNRLVELVGVPEELAADKPTLDAIYREPR